VKPEAVAADCNPQIEAALKEQAATIATDRLLELIDQFAAAEGRMKWAPNKKLHFEVAVIKAIQTLGQVTLNEVIENLTALRDGTAAAPPANPAPLARHNAVTPAVGATESRKPAATYGAAARPAAKPVVNPSASPAASDCPPAGDLSTELDLNAAWQKVVEQVRARRPLIRSWIESAKVLGSEGRSFQLGFPTEQQSVVDSLSHPKTRGFLEGLLKEASGKDWTLKFSLVDGLPIAPPAAPQPAEADRPAEAAATSIDAFKNDPLIQEALEIFKGEIKPVTN
jgi:DNA polymerase-3 subunit gamma/tau